MKDAAWSGIGDHSEYLAGSEQDIDSWRRLASDLGMELRPGFDAFIESPRLLSLGGLSGRSMPPDAERFRRLMENPLFSGYRDTFPGIVSGKRDGFDFNIYRTAERKTKRKVRWAVLILLLFEHPYEYGMRIARAGLTDGISRKLRMRRRIPVPDSPELDGLLEVRGDNRGQITVHLSDERTRSALLDLFKAGDSYEISDDGIKISLPGRYVGSDTALQHMRRMARAAGAFF